MMAYRFIAFIVATMDGFVARRSGHGPNLWASPEDQAMFLRAVDAADWTILGRVAHETAWRADRRRIVFSTQVQRPVWRGETHLWLDPAEIEVQDLVEMVAPVRPLRRCVVCGAPMVLARMLDEPALDTVRLTVEPIHFHDGVPFLLAQSDADPVVALQQRGWRVVEDGVINTGGTRHVMLRRR